MLWQIWPAAPLLSKFWPWDPLLPTSGHQAPQESAKLFPFRKAWVWSGWIQSLFLLPSLCGATRASPGASLGILSMKEGENGLRCPEGRYQCTGLRPSVCEAHILCSVELGDLKPIVALGGKSQGWSFGGPGNDIA